jgi:hypothetical protein
MPGAEPEKLWHLAHVPLFCKRAVGKRDWWHPMAVATNINTEEQDKDFIIGQWFLRNL